MIQVINFSRVARAARWLIAVCLFGCTLGPAETSPVRTYVLDPHLAAPAAAVRRPDATLLISLPKAEPGFDTARMAYVPRQHELGYYAFSQWADTPGRMLLRVLAHAMARTRLWTVVAQVPSGLRPDYRMDCDSLVLEQQFVSRPSRVRLALRAQLIDVKGESIIGARHFEIFQTSSSEDAYGGVVAANQAATDLLDELSHWAAALMDEDSPER
jgi:cholesterol transport system auxiliary component